MSYQVIWEPEALAQVAKLAVDDPEGVRQVFTTVDHLADNSQPEDAIGSADLLRTSAPTGSCTRSATSRSAVIVIHLGRVH
ncbi:type II toxin-antitoxin system RelE/ParE family toxin [Streptomyces diacarni]|uniref:type II toxin-antitoxin system RelE/ParE family toxin n=1 Tax=Streptomyces diacarni TaxID=2800381 RepID=UPI0033D7E923